MCVHVKSLQSCLTLCDPMDCSLSGSSVHGILQARMLEWVSMLSSRGSSWPRDRTQVSCITVLPGKPDKKNPWLRQRQWPARGRTEGHRQSPGGKLRLTLASTGLCCTPTPSSDMREIWRVVRGFMLLPLISPLMGHNTELLTFQLLMNRKEWTSIREGQNFVEADSRVQTGEHHENRHLVPEDELQAPREPTAETVG